MSDRILKIGIASYDEIKKRTMSIARGEYKPKKSEPRIWFSSIESLAQVLSTKNQLLLEIILTNQPESITELAELSHRHKSNLSRTLRTMERYGLVELKKEANHFVPKVRFDRIEVDLGLLAEARQQ
jgi:predicted transcriptional regulator